MTGGGGVFASVWSLSGVHRSSDTCLRLGRHCVCWGGGVSTVAGACRHFYAIRCKGGGVRM